MNCTKNEPWDPTDATYAIREIGKHPALSIAYKMHARQRMSERGIIVSDVLQLLRRGFVYDLPIEATSRGYYRYVIQGRTPNSGKRDIAAVIIPNPNTMAVKIVTVYWVDEHDTKSGTLMEDPK